MGVLLMASFFLVKSRLANYKVHFIDDLGSAMGSQHASGAFLVIDADLPSSAKICKLFPQERIIRLKADEKTKTLEGCTALINSLVSRQFRRDHVIFAVGGGVIQDVVAFVSTVLYRGIDWVFFPTTLLFPLHPP